MRCERCAGERFTKVGRDRSGRQLSRCVGCGRRLTARTGSALCGYRFPDDVIALAVRWHLRDRLSYAEVAEWLAERGVAVDPSTIYDGVQAFTPALRTLLSDAEHRSSKYLNNGLERDHQSLKGRVRAMRRFNGTLRSAQAPGDETLDVQQVRRSRIR